MRRIYLDHNATTALDPRVRDAMLPWLGDQPGNASSTHAFGREARRAIDRARAQVARLIGAQPEEIVFTSGGTEANNLALLGAVAAAGCARPHLVTTAIEHQSVLNPCRHLERTGAALTLVPVDGEGLVDPEALLAALGDDTLLVSVMLANNDVGTVEPVAALASRLGERGVLLHTDAVQAVGRLAVDVGRLGVDLLSLSGHKLHGPQGIGALYRRRGARVAPLLFGGHQEGALRPGTENVAAIVGFGQACELARQGLVADAARTSALRDAFEQAVVARVPGVTVNGRGAPRLPNTSNLSFEGLEGEALVQHLDLLGLAASTGSACSSGDREPSPVLLAMGRDAVQARSSVRFSFGREQREDDVARAVELVVAAVARMRGEPRSRAYAVAPERSATRGHDGGAPGGGGTEPAAAGRAAPRRARFARQSARGLIGPDGQAALARSTVLIVGCGALGSTQAELLARAGIGRLILVDRDVVELDNLPRQLLFDERDSRERMPKAVAAARRLRAIDSEIVLEARVADVTAANVAELLGPADLVLDGTDNFETRYLLNDAVVRARKPWIYGGVLGTEGTVMAVRPGEGPCLRCVLPDPPDSLRLPSCETRGVLNTAVSWVAALQVTEALRLLVRDPTAEPRLCALDVRRGTVRSIRVERDPACTCCGAGRFEFLSGERGASTMVLCGRHAVQIAPERPSPLDLDALSRRLAPRGAIACNGLLLELTGEGHRLVVFPDGRVLVMGTTDPAEARSLVARYLGG